MKILLIGANGQLGSDLAEVLKAHDLIPATHQELDVVRFEKVQEEFRKCQPEVVINTAAFHRVDVCETEVMSAFEVNAYGVRNLALAAREVEAVLVHFSTDYVFDGKSSQPYTESDLPNPINAYGVSKLAGEKLLEYLWQKCFIIRTCGLYGHAGSSGKGGNFVEMMLRKALHEEPIRVVEDQRLTPTSTRELARKVKELIQTKHYGLYHITSNGECSWYEFAREIFGSQGIKANLTPTTSREFRAVARRPAYSVLENARLKQLGMDDLKDWREALHEYLKNRTRTVS
ncbi:MAG: dTDP-4-dehydrorhamnose reductase [Acidobacteria bacterium]|nr:MAG: dTDP-4-dehydrorhamnose reductase [Acidobacteriota bacterium]